MADQGPYLPPGKRLQLQDAAAEAPPGSARRAVRGAVLAAHLCSDGSLTVLLLWQVPVVAVSVNMQDEVGQV